MRTQNEVTNITPARAAGQFGQFRRQNTLALLRSKSLRMEMYEVESYVHGHHIVSGFEKKLSFVRERSGILRICMLYGRDVRGHCCWLCF